MGGTRAWSGFQFVGPSYYDLIITNVHLLTWRVACRGRGELRVGRRWSEYKKCVASPSMRPSLVGLRLRWTAPSPPPPAMTLALPSLPVSSLQNKQQRGPA